MILMPSSDLASDFVRTLGMDLRIISVNFLDLSRILEILLSMSIYNLSFGVE